MKRKSMLGHENAYCDQDGKHEDKGGSADAAAALRKVSGAAWLGHWRQEKPASDELGGSVRQAAANFSSGKASISISIPFSAGLAGCSGRY